MHAGRYFDIAAIESDLVSTRHPIQYHFHLSNSPTVPIVQCNCWLKKMCCSLYFYSLLSSKDSCHLQRLQVLFQHHLLSWKFFYFITSSPVTSPVIEILSSRNIVLESINVIVILPFATKKQLEAPFAWLCWKEK